MKSREPLGVEAEIDSPMMDPPLGRSHKIAMEYRREGRGAKKMQRIAQLASNRPGHSRAGGTA